MELNRVDGGKSLGACLTRETLGDGLQVVKVTNSGSKYSVKVCLLGGTLVSYVAADGEDKLFLSANAVTDGSKAVRGGVPVVFPQFGKSGPLKQHGFARNSIWEIFGEPEESADERSVIVRFRLLPTDAIKEEWGEGYSDFELIHEVEFGASHLRTTLFVHNMGTAAFNFQALLHTYYRVADISATGVGGLHGLEFKDQLTAKDEKETEQRVSIGQEVDRIYRDAESVVIICETHKVEIGVELRQGDKKRPCDVVLWNPWTDKSKVMGDFGDEEFNTMICVEPGLVSRFEECAPSDTWSLTQKILFSKV